MYSRIKNALYRLIDKRIYESIFFNDIRNTGMIDGTAVVRGGYIHGSVSIGEGAYVFKSVISGNNIQIGKYTSINGPNTTIYSEVNAISIGNFCSIARNVDIQEWNHPIHTLSTCMMNNKLMGGNIREEMESKGAIKIGHDVWIGAQAVILSGATIGDGAIIGANAVVAGNIPPYAIAVGNPAKVIRYRFNEETIAQLLKIEWWNWEIEKIKNNIHLFQLNINLNNEMLKNYA
jgi:virginiamycin A acetyltransferase